MGLVKNTITWISWERNIIFLWNKKILNLCLRWHILRSYCFVAEVTFKHGILSMDAAPKEINRLISRAVDAVTSPMELQENCKKKKIFGCKEKSRIKVCNIIYIWKLHSFSFLMIYQPSFNSKYNWRYYLLKFV